MKKKIFRTIIKLVVLSEEPIDENLDIQDIMNECDEGAYIGTTNIGTPTTLIGKTAVIEIEKAGSDAGFFNMSTDGNELDFDGEGY